MATDQDVEYNQAARFTNAPARLVMPARTILVLCVCCCAASAYADHWSFAPRTKPELPRLAETERAWVRTSVDAFVLARLKEKGLKPAPPAERRVLIRRLSFDLTGLPPTPKDIAAFIKDDAADAYERLVERLLASPRYGERWAQHWLDVVRYAESEGFEYDNYLPGMWRYRDYVIRSFNEDKPYGRFLTEQLAGDELKPNDPDLQIAAGFHRLGPVRRNVGNQNVAFSRNEVLTEQTDAVGMVFLGLTVGCARCHDHRFDDFTQEDYYRLQAFLAGAKENNVILADAKTKAQWDAVSAPLQKEIGELKRQIGKAKGADKERLHGQLKAVQGKLPPPLPTLCTVREDELERTAIHVLRRGMPEKKGKRVEPGFPSALRAHLSDIGKSPRVALAQWLAHPDHPLTARVMVNRVWHYHFGRGLVATPNDLGVNGSGASHPELLDYLANEFIRQGMHLKPLHRMIVLSNTYKQAAAAQHADPASARTRDPDNRLYWHYPRRRLSAEELRDAMLTAAGRLNLKAGGPSVVTPLAQDLVDLLYDPSQWKVTPDVREHERRSIFLIAKRNLRPPFGQAFDQPDLQTSCPRRESSTHALQALELMNGELTNHLAEVFAKRLEKEENADSARMVEQAFLLTTGRPPTATERERCVAFLRSQPPREFALAMFNLNAFLYVD
jgi:Protein of unknown function (DUF1553)/Protein of unknown function (DUF1549)